MLLRREDALPRRAFDRRGLGTLRRYRDLHPGQRWRAPMHFRGALVAISVDGSHVANAAWDLPRWAGPLQCVGTPVVRASHATAPSASTSRSESDVRCVIRPRWRILESCAPAAGHDVVVAILGYVWFWPNGGHVNRFWGDGSGPGEDAIARTSRRVTERYSEALGTFGIEARRAAVQMSVSDAETDDTAVVLELTLRPAGDEVVRAFVPPGVAEMTMQDRARVVLEIVDTAMVGIGEARGWPEDALRQSRQHTIEHHLDFDMTGAWKSDRRRKRAARPVARITDDGWSDLSFEVSDSRSGESLGFTRSVRSPLNSLPKFARGAREFRWSDVGTIERPDDWRPRFGSDWGPVDVFDIDDLHEWPQVVHPVPKDSPLPVEVRNLTG